MSLPARSRWERLEWLFVGGAALPPHERSAWLERECPDDLDLRREAESMLSLDDVAARDLSAVIETTATSLFREERLEGVVLGAWRIVREIGRGGMGTVYLAIRDGADFEKRVAIKVVKGGVDSESVVARFRDELRILAGLDHPYIARLIDAGASPEGQPYFIMEFVDGVSIAEYCLRENLTIRNRCELFRRICEPVSYAHGRLVIHRDLKPANILVMADGSPRLLDFGIARILTSSAPDERAVARLTHALTPQYASPEQLRGEQVDTASDIYSLGVILRELLGGGIAADLASIVAKATAVRPEDRYRSVERLSEDVGRFLENRPVQAYQHSPVYRARCFLRRNRVPVGVVVAGAVLTVAGVTSILWESRQARTEGKRAEQRLGLMVEMANHAIFDVQNDIEKLPGSTDTRRKLLRSTVDYLDQLRRDSARDKISEDPRLLAALAAAYHQVANIEGSPLHANLGELGSSEESFGKAKKLMAALVARDPSNLTFRLRSASLNSDYGEMLYETARTDPAVELFKAGLTDIGFVLAANPRDFEARKIASTLHLRLTTATMDRDIEGARRDDLDQLPLNDALVKEHPEDIESLLNLASTWSQIGTSYVREAKLTEALDAFHRTATLRERAIAMKPDDVAVQRDLLIVYGHTGDTLGSPLTASLGKYKEAIDWYVKAGAIAQKMSIADPSDKRARLDYGISLMRIGASQTAAGNAREGLVSLNRSAVILDPLSAGKEVNASSFTQIGMLHEYLARALWATGQLNPAISNWWRSLEICQRVLAVNKTHRACGKQEVVDRIGLAELLAERGETEDALTQASLAREKAEALLKGTYNLDKAYWARSLAGTGAVYMVMARHASSPEESRANWTQARDYLHKAVAEWKPLQGLDASFAEEAHATAQQLAECERAIASRQ